MSGKTPAGRRSMAKFLLVCIGILGGLSAYAKVEEYHHIQAAERLKAFQATPEGQRQTAAIVCPFIASLRSGPAPKGESCEDQFPDYFGPDATKTFSAPE